MKGIKLQKYQFPKKKLPYKSFEEYIKNNVEKFRYIYPTAIDYSSAYINELFADYHHVIIKNDVEVLENYKSRYVNIINNHRHTAFQPETYTNTIFIFGDSRVAGVGVEDNHTLPSCLQHLLNIHFPQKGYRVENKGIGSITPLKMYNKILQQSWTPGDIVIICTDLHNGMGKIGGNPELLTFYMLENISNICKSYEVTLICLQFPELERIISPSIHEQELQLITFDNDKSLIEISNHNKGISNLSLLCIANDLPFVDTTVFFHRPHEQGEIFVDHVHLNHSGHQRIAKFILNLLSFRWKKEEYKEIFPTLLRAASLQEYQEAHDTIYKQINNYIQSVLSVCSLPLTKSNGAIVMNCNPFTLGHLFLIEEASRHVETLFIFVVEENLSFFNFQKRILMVKNGTAHIPNIMVVPSGNFIISSNTLPEYFTKESYSNSPLNAEYDLEIFGKYIAPPLNINIRFIGEEPFCPITHEYNFQMKTILRKYGIAVVEVPRLTLDNEAITATKVRENIKKGDINKITHMVPASTLEIIQAENQKNKSVPDTKF